MKKTYMRCRVGLFAGLISFNALASCANTERTLGMGLCQSKETKKQRELERQYKDQMKKLNNRSSINKDSWYNSKSCYATIAGTATSVITGLLWYLYYNVPSESTTEPTMANTTMPFPGNGTTNVVADGAPLAPVVNTTMAYVGNAIATAATAATTVLPTVGLIAVLKNGTNSVVMPSMSNIPMESSSARPILPTYEKAISHMEEHGFSVESIRDYLYNGFGINDKDVNGKTILMAAANYENYAGVKFSVEQGADVNAKSNDRRRVLMYIKNDSPESTRILKYLIREGADPCIKNEKGQLSKPNPGVPPESVKLLSEEQQKKCS